MLKTRGGLLTFLEENCLDEDVSVTLLKPTLKILDFQLYLCHHIATLDLKSERT